MDSFWWYALGSVVVGYGLLMVRGGVLSARVRAERKGFTLEAFKKELENRNYEPAAIEAAFSDFIRSRGHPVFPSDALERTLGFLPEEFDDMLEDRARLFGVQDVQNSSYASLFPLNSVQDYVHFLSEVVRGERKKSAS